jgi:uncharacterized protein YvpB
MSFRDPYRRRSSPWPTLLLLVLLAGAVAAGVLAYGAWRASQQATRALADQVEVLRAELGAANGRAAALEARLGVLEVANPAAELAALRSAVDELKAEVAAVKSAQQPALTPAPQATAVGAGSAPQEVRLTVPRQRQSHSLSCESSAASMAATYAGVPLSEGEIVAALPRDANPHLGFRGNIDGPTGSIVDYGVYAEPVAAVLQDRGLRATPVEGGLDGIKAALARGHAVVAWITYNCLVSTPVKTTVDGRDVVLVPYQHAVVVTGYTPDGVWANDPYDGGEDFYAAADFERALGYFGDMAIEVAAP